MRSGRGWRAFHSEFDRKYFGRMVLLIVITTMVMSLFGLAFETGPTQDIAVDVLNLDDAAPGPSVANAIIARMETGSTVRIVNSWSSSDEDAFQRSMDDLEAGNVEAVIVFGSNFSVGIATWIASSQNATSATPSALILYIDSSNPMAAASVQAEVQRSAQLVVAFSYDLSFPVNVVPVVVYGDGTDMRDFMAAAIAGLLIFILSLMPVLNGSNDDGDEELGSQGAVIAAKTMSSLINGLAMSATVLVVSFLFGLRMEGSLWAVFTIFSLLAMASSSLGLLLGALLKGRAGLTMAIFPLLLYPAILLGGIVLPISSVPSYLLPISYMYPLTYAIDGARLVMLNGFGWDGCWIQLLSLILYTMVCLAIVWFLGRMTARSGAAGKRDKNGR